MAYALITGASGGIGLALAKELASRKHDLILVARSRATLDTIAQNLTLEHQVKVLVCALDLSIHDSHQQLLHWVNQEKLAIDILINNAGYGLWGKVESTALGDLQNMMDLNMQSLVRLCHVFIPLLKQHSPACIMNVASTAAYQAVPTLATYAATKSFVVSFSRGLRWELRSSGITVTCLSPGATSTGFVDRAGMASLKERAEKFSMKADTVARIAIEGMLKGKAEIVPGFTNWISVKLVGLLPKSWVERIAAGLYQ